MMKKIETVSIVGLGAIGCVCLSILDKALPPEQIRVIASGSRGENYRVNGVEINGKTHKFQVVDPSDDTGPADLILLAVKYSHLEQAMEDMRKQVGPDTVILSLLNGITSESILAGEFGEEKVLYSLIVGTDAVRLGTSTTFTSPGKIPFGEAKNIPGQLAPQVLRVQEFFQRTGIFHEIPQDMQHSLWWKFMINVGINQVSAVLRSTYGPLQRVGAGRALMLEAWQEVVTLSQKAGVNLTQADIDQALQVVDALGPKGKTSMAQDVDAGRKTEVEIFSGTMLELGERYSVDVPVNRMLNRLIIALEESFGVR